MALTGLISFLPTLWSGVKEFIRKKQEVQKLERVAEIELRKAQLNAQIERAKSHDAADTMLDKASLEQTGWKDEYLLILTTTPMVLIMASPFLDIYMMAMYSEDFIYKTGMIQEAVFHGFKALKEAPELYWYLLGAVYIHSLGMRRMLRIMLEKGFSILPKK